MTGWEIYWITRFDGIHTMATVTAILACMCLLMTIVAWFNWEDVHKDVKAALRRWIPGVAVLFVLAVITVTIVPTTKEAAAIYILPKIINSEFASETLPADMRELYKLAIEAVKAKLAVPR
jgi:hypothetical protein